MTFQLIEPLELRVLLSPAVVESPLSADALAAMQSPVIDVITSPLVVHAPLASSMGAKVAIPDLKATYSCKTKFGGISGTAVLVIKSQNGTRINGELYSLGWGGFDAKVSGRARADQSITLSGKSKTFRLKKLQGTFNRSGSKLRVSLQIEQMNIPVDGDVLFQRTTRPLPPPGPASAPSLLGDYQGTATEQGDDPDQVGITIIRQVGGLVWGKTNGGASLTGVVLKDGRFHFIMKQSGGQTRITGQVNTQGQLVGEWTWYDDSGDVDSGTFLLNRV